MEIPYTTCNICFFSYNENVKRPLLLQCGHSFCQECLQQLDRDRNKLCPCCRESWQSLKLTDLTFCRQLIPEQAHVKTSSSGVALCERHNVCLTLWCDACQCLLCVKCIPVNHSECELRLIKNKRADTEHRFSTVHQELTIGAINETDLLILNEDLDKYKQIKWQDEITEGLAMLQKSDEKHSIETCFKKLEQILEDIKNAENPALLLMLVIKAYTAARGGTPELFMSHFLEKQSSFFKLQATAAADRRDSKAEAPELNEGQEWTLLDYKDIEPAKNILRKTSVRPSAIRVKFLNSERIPDSEEFLDVFSRVKSEIKFLLLNCFWTVSDSSRETTRRIVNLIKQSDWCSPVELWGHLDAAAVKLLPNTVQRVGLVLASADDMEAVNALQRYMTNSTLKEINFSILKTFKIENWIINLNLSTMKGGSPLKGVGLNAFQLSGIALALHFPNLKCSNIEWMFHVIKQITHNFAQISIVKRLYLPFTDLTPDTLLGVLRDVGLTCEVHLSPSLTAKKDREAVEVQYNKHKCTIIWDAE